MGRGTLNDKERGRETCTVKTPRDAPRHKVFGAPSFRNSFKREQNSLSNQVCAVAEVPQALGKERHRGVEPRRTQGRVGSLLVQQMVSKLFTHMVF